MRDEHDLTAATEAAWRAFRGRLADHVAGLADDAWLEIEPAHDDDVEHFIVQVGGCGYAAVYGATEAHHPTLAGLGWVADDEDETDWSLTFEGREADRVAYIVAATLREVHGVLHPLFLSAEGLEVDPDAPVVHVTCAGMAGPEDEAEADDPTYAVMPRSREHLQQLVDEAMTQVFPDLKHDDDGDIPIRCGQSSAFVRVLADRPAVEVYAEVLIDPVDTERLQAELGLLNAANPAWQLVRLDGRVVMRCEVVALPFAPFQLRLMVDRFCDDVDRIAHELQARVGGRLFLAPSPAPVEEDLVLTGLLELCHLGRPRAATVAGLFDHDRLEIIRQIVRIRDGRQSCGEHDEELVLGALRRALRLVSDGEPQRAAPLPPKPRSVQSSLLSDTELGEESLDLGWGG